MFLASLTRFPDAEYKIVELPILGKHFTRDSINLTLPLGYLSVRLCLQPNVFSYRNNVPYLVRRDNYSQIVGDKILDVYNCFYSQNANNVKASIDVCDGLVSIILQNNLVLLVHYLYV